MPLATLPPDSTPNAQEMARLKRDFGWWLKDADLIYLLKLQCQGTDRFLLPTSDLAGWEHLGFPDYAAYRGRDLWKKIRQRVLVSFCERCVGCGKTTSIVHHRDYRPRVIRGDDDLPLVAICETCHNKVHARDYEIGDRYERWREQECRLAALVAEHDAQKAQAAA